MRLNYNTATIEEMALHFKGASRQLLYITKERYRDNPAMLDKIAQACARVDSFKRQDAIKTKITKLEAEIACLQDELGALESTFEVTKHG